MDKSAALLILVLCLAPRADARTTVTLRESATVRDAFVRLEAVARLDGERADHIADIFLGRAPEAGGTLVIDREAVAARLRLRGLVREDITFRGANEVRVTRADAPVVTAPELIALPENAPRPGAGIGQASRPTETHPTPQATPETAQAPRAAADGDPRAEGIRKAAERYLRDLIGLPDMRIELVPVTLSYDPQAATRATGILVEQGPAGRLNGRIEFRFAFIDRDRQRLGEVTAAYDATISAPVLLCRSDLRRGDVITQDNLLREYRPITGSDRLVSDPKQVTGKRALRAVRARAALSADDIESVPAVERNQLVQIITVVGSFSVQAIGRAQERGQLGDLVMVQNLDSGQRFAARVAAPGVVTVNQ